MCAQSSTNDHLVNPLSVESGKSRARALSREHLRIQQVENELNDARTQLTQYRDLYIRQRAEMENYSKAVEREKKLISKNASRNVIKDLLPLVDSLDSAITSSKENNNVVAIRNQMEKILSAYGFTPIEAKGKKFDPYLHEVIAVSPSDNDGMVLEEVQKGYKLNDEVIRTSKVIVGKKGD